MLYLIGLGLNVDGISKYGTEIVKRCKRVYLESYTVDFPYSIGELSQVLDKKILPADRKFVEGLSIVDEAKRLDVALLIYGSPLAATTHIALIQEARRLGIKVKSIHNASVLDAAAETGLQLYKFGKISSMPTWQENYTPDSFMKSVQENLSIDAHSLILIDPGLEFPDALIQLEKAAENYKMTLKKILVCQNLGTKHQKIFYRSMNGMKEFTGIRKPYCIIIPGKLHFIESEVLEEFK